MPYADVEKYRAYQRRWREENHAKKLEEGRRWSKANPQKGRMYRAKRRAAEALAKVGDLQAAAAYAEILRKGICELCGTKGAIEIDHIEPLSKGGEHGWENFAGLCKPCNRTKYDQPLLIGML